MMSDPKTEMLTLNLADESESHLEKPFLKKKRHKVLSVKRNVAQIEEIDNFPTKKRATSHKTVKNDLNEKQTLLTTKDKISSLFTSNPEIPFIPKSNVTTKLEKVFSEDKFASLPISSKLISNLKNCHLETMTLVQKRSIPLILNWQDALIRSQTGSGKTLSYALPIVHILMTSCIWVVPGYLIGGEKKKAEKSRLRKGVNILIATPGRLKDHIASTKVLSFSALQYLVIDEADKLLDMGYEKDIHDIINALSEHYDSSLRQTIMMSATLTKDVEKLAGITLHSPVIVDVSSEESGIENSDLLSSDILVTPENLSHYYMIIPPKLRLVVLSSFILWKCLSVKERKLLIFMATQDMVDYHTDLFGRVLRKFDYDKDSAVFLKLHGNMLQHDRLSVFKAFKEAEAGVLLCTDVAARGLDLPKVNWIIQYNAAISARDYVHRVGRTSRVNADGSAVIFLTPSEADYIKMLESYHIKINEVQLQVCLSKLLPNYEKVCDTYEKFPHSVEEAASKLQMEYENLILHDSQLKDAAVKGYISFVRSYASYPREMREIFNFKVLHLGHFAKSFALREAPAVLGAKLSKKFKMKNKLRPDIERYDEFTYKFEKYICNLLKDKYWRLKHQKR